MSVFGWLRSLFGGARTRDVTRLAPAEGDDAAAEVVEELVPVSGPIKEHHLRRALRDRRLLPKVIRRKRGKLIPGPEAARLFAATMRTRNRKLRDLLADEQQLGRYGLPVWRNEPELAQVLGVSLKELWFFAMHRERERQPHYVTFAIPKRSGGRRLIMAPKRRLKAIQRKLQSELVDKLPVSDCAHAFRRGRSIRTGAEPHLGKRAILKLDLKDFFPSVTVARVRGLLIAYGYSYPVATTLAVLMTEAERQPVEADGAVYHVPLGERHCVQGAPTSPGICNALLLRLDRRLAGLARKHGLQYTRYADDLTFSGDLDRNAAAQVRAVVERIVVEEGFAVNPKKTRFMPRSSRQTVTGVVVNKELGLSRKERRRWRAMIHNLRRENGGEIPGPMRRRIAGKIAYLSMLNRGQAFRLSPGTSPQGMLT